YLLGIDYMPMRKEFWDVELKRKTNEIKNILLTFGGQDVNGLTYNILNTLINRYPHLNYHIIKGSLNNNSRNEKKYSSNVKFYFSLSAKEILELMLDTDIAITACGQTTYELARVGVPSIGIATADNQKYNLEGWYNVGFFKEEIWYNDNYTNNVLGLFSEYLTTNIEKISYCDGQGSRRIVKFLLNKFITEDGFYFRKATKNDSELIFNLSNDKLVRNNSINTEEILVDTHIKWFDEKLKDENYIILLAKDKNDIFIGQVKFELHNDNAIISISICKNYRGKGFAKKMLEKSCGYIFENYNNINEINAYIRPENISSKKSFEGVGFIYDCKEKIREDIFYLYKFKRK
ncbi:MAG: UDP-2,4-diacetamido-2,4,6-trideoxy-beta-L-altropyranose hydrolase, partial [Ignavibacteriales bacterium]|nr:UDP-2,4-diacetamido-2,4,6-trideoxy-beta-L-altropyranose hydrolase [Ignavibacteriales bacterium]